MNVLLLAVLLLLGPIMSDVREIGVGYTGTDVTLTTTTQTVAVSSGRVTFPSASGTIVVYGWAQLTTGTGTTAVTATIRRGTAITGTIVGEANAQTIGAAAGSTEVFTVLVSEGRTSVADVEYSLTLTQAGATGNGTALQSGIVVLVL